MPSAIFGGGAAPVDPEDVAFLASVLSPSSLLSSRWATADAVPVATAASSEDQPHDEDEDQRCCFFQDEEEANQRRWALQVEEDDHRRWVVVVVMPFEEEGPPALRIRRFRFWRTLELRRVFFFKHSQCSSAS